MNMKHLQFLRATLSFKVQQLFRGKTFHQVRFPDKLCDLNKKLLQRGFLNIAIEINKAMINVFTSQKKNQ